MAIAVNRGEGAKIVIILILFLILAINAFIPSRAFSKETALPNLAQRNTEERITIQPIAAKGSLQDRSIVSYFDEFLNNHNWVWVKWTAGIGTGAVVLFLVWIIILQAQVRAKTNQLRQELDQRKNIEAIMKVRLSLLEFANTHALHELLQKTLDEIGDLTSSPIGFYHFVDPDQKTLSLQAWSTRTLNEFCSTKGQGMHYDIGRAGVWVDCVHQKKPVIHNDYNALPHRKGMPAGHIPVQRELIVPIMRDGQVKAILGIGNKASDYTEKDTLIVSYLADIAWEIANRKKAEEAAVQSEQLFRETMMHLEEGYYSVTPEGILLDHNPAFNRILGIDPSRDLRGTDTPAFWRNPADRERYLNKLKTDGLVANFEVEIITADNSRKAVLLNARLETGKDDLSQRISGTANDITKRKQAEEALGQLMSRQEVLLSAIPDIIMEVDNNKVYTWTNQAGLAFFGPDVVGQKAEHYFEGVQDTYEQLAPLFQGQEELIRVESWQRRKDGKKRLLAWRCRSLKDDQGTIIGALSSARDITDFAALRQQFQQAQKMESIGRLAGGIAHDFNNMLGVIIGRSELALEHTEPGQSLYGELMEIRSAALRSADLTRQLLAFARKQEICPKVLDLNDTVMSSLKILRRLIGEDVELVWKPALALWPVKMDPIQIDQLLANLAVNARDAIEDIGTVTIQTENVILDAGYCESHAGFIPGEYATLTVSDDGCGMDTDTLEHLFEPFFTTKGVGVGTGLGLATVYGIVKQNNGFINVYSEIGHGSTFSIFLPRTEENPATDTQAAENEPPRGCETLLLVEDDLPTLELGEAILERYGYTVLSAGTPKQAIAIAEQYNGTINLLITDVVMPEMNGKQMMERINAIRSNQKVLFMSGYTADAISCRGVLDQGVDFIQKPFSVRGLTNKIREVLDRQPN